jgi:hypothetical protein
MQKKIFLHAFAFISESLERFCRSRHMQVNALGADSKYCTQRSFYHAANQNPGFVSVQVPVSGTEIGKTSRPLHGKVAVHLLSFFDKKSYAAPQ